MNRRLFEYFRSRTAARYVASGISAFIFEYSSYLFLYYIFNTSIRFAADGSYLFAWAVSFFLTRNFVFSHTKKVGNQKQLIKQSVLYSLLIGINFLFNNFAVVWLSQQGVKPYMGKILTIGIIACWNFLIYKKIIFKAED